MWAFEALLGQLWDQRSIWCSVLLSAALHGGVMSAEHVGCTTMAGEGRLLLELACTSDDVVRWSFLPSEMSK